MEKSEIDHGYGNKSELPWKKSPPTSEMRAELAERGLEPLTDDGSGNDVYTIMPATFEPGKVGSFFLSVVADCEFMLKRDTSTDRKPRN